MRAVQRLAAVVVLLAATPLSGSAQIPTFRDVVGREIGARITQHHEMVRYLETLAAASPRVTIVEQGSSWEGRSFLVAVVTAESNHARIGQIQAASRRLADPLATSADQAEILFATQPVVMWFGGSIHGFELSGSEAALRLLERLTTQDDPATLEVLERVVVLIDPMLNPDGRDAFARLNHENLGRVPNPNNEDWANDFTPWQSLKFRTGHYYFDNNRDWFAQTQPATRHRMTTIRTWRPQVMTDMHEMGPDLEFFFYPGPPPVSPHVPDFSLRWIERFADAYAASFDSTKVEYVTRELFDFFYPGYTDSYANFQGAVGMLYEQGSSRGLALMRSDRSTRTLREAVDHHYTAAWTALRLAATERGTLLREYYQGLVDAVAAGRAGTRRYLVTPDGDPADVTELVNVLLRGGVTVGRITDSTVLDGVQTRSGMFVGRRAFPPGTYVVEAAQPRSHLVRTLMEPETPLPEEFVAEARARVDRGESAEIYDITAWSLPLLFNVHGFSSTNARSLTTEPVGEDTAPAGDDRLRRTAYAYLLDGRHAASVAALYHLMDRGYRVAMTLRPTRLDGRDVPSGTGVVLVGQNDSSVYEAVRSVAARFAVNVRPVTSGLAPEGYPSLGSADVIPLRKPAIAMLAEDPISGYSFGWTWFTLDREYEIPTTVLRVGSVAGTPLDRFDVIIVPDAPPAPLRAALGEDGVSRIHRWVRDGGTLVTLAGATDFARDSLIALRSWYDTDVGEEAQRFTVPGAILRSQLDEQHWLSAGYGETDLPVLANRSAVYLPPEGPPSPERRVVVRYATRDSLRISGLVWEESLDRLAGTVFAYEERVGLGRVIAFAEDVNFRGFWRGARRMFLNAVIAGTTQ